MNKSTGKKKEAVKPDETPKQRLKTFNIPKFGEVKAVNMLEACEKVEAIKSK